MPTAAQNQQSGRKHWFSRDKKAERDRRIEEIQNINDPGTSRDEVLTGSKYILRLLLAFTGSIAAFSYFKFFSQNIPPIVAIAAAVILAIVIEYGKNYMATKSLREVFFSGWGNIFSSIPETIYFAGVTIMAGVCFYVSIINSTVGARELSRLLSFQKNDAESTFRPDTKVLDDQIAAIIQGQRAKQNITWKGTVTKYAQKSIQADSRTVEKLNAQRAAVIEQQRADFQRRQEQLIQQSNHTSGMVFQIGGWVELLQILLSLIRVSCERILVDRQIDREEAQPTPPQQPRTDYFRQSDMGSAPSFAQNSRPPGYNVGADGNVIRATPSAPTLPADDQQGTQDEVLFKQTGDVFKQIVEAGRVVGLMYRKKSGDWQPLSEADVRSRAAIYQHRDTTKPSEATMAGKDQWEWALAQFDTAHCQPSRFKADKPIAEQILERYKDLPMEVATA